MFYYPVMFVVSFFFIQLQIYNFQGRQWSAEKYAIFFVQSFGNSFICLMLTICCLLRGLLFTEKGTRFNLIW